MVEIEKASIVSASSSVETGYGKYVISPLERGFGITLGNALRRVLLSSVPGAAATSINIQGVAHEFSTVPGVKEDVAEIILNIKRLSVKMHTDQVKTCRIEAQGPCEVTAADIICDEEIEMVRPTQHIATLNEGASLNMQINFATGHGYVLADKNKTEDMAIGDIAVDSIFTPVSKVKIDVEDTRVGQITDYDALTVQIWCDGSIVPDEAISIAANILINHLSMLVGLSSKEELNSNAVVQQEESDKAMDMTIEELDLSVRAYNCLKRAGINTVSELTQRNQDDMMRVRNLGRKSLEEVEQKLKNLGLSFQENNE